MVNHPPVAPPEQKPAEAAVANAKVPDHVADILSGRRKRIPMSTATRKMEVAAIDGFYLYWFAETNIPAALQAGYEFVDRSETNLVQTGLAIFLNDSANTLRLDKRASINELSCELSVSTHRLANYVLPGLLKPQDARGVRKSKVRSHRSVKLLMHSTQSQTDVFISQIVLDCSA